MLKHLFFLVVGLVLLVSAFTHTADGIITSGIPMRHLAITAFICQVIGGGACILHSVAMLAWGVLVWCLATYDAQRQRSWNHMLISDFGPDYLMLELQHRWLRRLWEWLSMPSVLVVGDYCLHYDRIMRDECSMHAVYTTRRQDVRIDDSYDITRYVHAWRAEHAWDWALEDAAPVEPPCYAN